MLAECVANCVLSTGTGKKKGWLHFLERKQTVLADTFERKWSEWNIKMMPSSQVVRYDRCALSYLDINILLASEFFYLFGLLPRPDFMKSTQHFWLMNTDVNRNHQSWNGWLYYDNSDPKRPKDFVTIHCLSGRTINSLLIPCDVEDPHVLKGVIPAGAL